MSTSESKFLAKREKIKKNVIEFFKVNFPDAGDPVDFETVWPISKWDYLQTETMNYSVELNMRTGKVIKIMEDRS